MRSYGGRLPPLSARRQAVDCGPVEGGPAPAGAQRQAGSGKEPENGEAPLPLCKRYDSGVSTAKFQAADIQSAINRVL